MKAFTFLKIPGLVFAHPMTPNSDGSSRGGISVVRQVGVQPGIGHTDATR